MIAAKVLQWGTWSKIWLILILTANLIRSKHNSHWPFLHMAFHQPPQLTTQRHSWDRALNCYSTQHEVYLD
jgi:hypothetical protein